jgi:hypothetical protein
MGFRVRELLGGTISKGVTDWLSTVLCGELDGRNAPPVPEGIRASAEDAGGPLDVSLLSEGVAAEGSGGLAVFSGAMRNGEYKGSLGLNRSRSARKSPLGRLGRFCATSNKDPERKAT